VLGTPGSLVRPEIILEISLGYGLSQAAATDLAIGLEYFHTASLLCDDLPSIDDASERRGTPCAHLKFGDAGAILAALALVNRAYALTRRSVSACLSERRSQGLAYVERHSWLGRIAQWAKYGSALCAAVPRPANYRTESYGENGVPDSADPRFTGYLAGRLHLTSPRCLLLRKAAKALSPPPATRRYRSLEPSRCMARLMS